MKKPPVQHEEEGETPQEIGRRLANQRMPKIKKGLKGIGNLGKYKMTSDDRQYIKDHLTQWMQETFVRLDNGQAESDDFFLK